MDAHPIKSLPVRLQAAIDSIDNAKAKARDLSHGVIYRSGAVSDNGLNDNVESGQVCQWCGTWTPLPIGALTLASGASVSERAPVEDLSVDGGKMLQDEGASSDPLSDLVNEGKKDLENEKINMKMDQMIALMQDTAGKLGVT